MRLRHIEVFSAIMRTGTTSAAARLLNVSQPAVSKTLQHAEQTLGFALFRRSRGKLLPTPEALALQQEVSAFDDQLARIRRLADSLGSQSAAPLRVTATPALAHHLLPPTIALWRRKYPDTVCELDVAHTREMVHALLLNETDLGLTLQPVAHPSIVCTPVLDAGLRVIAPASWWPESLLSQPVAAEELSGQPIVAIDLRDHLGSLVSAWLGSVEPPPKVKLSVQTYGLARTLVEAGNGVAIVDSFTAKTSAEASPIGRIQVRELDMPANLKVYALTADNHPPPKMAEHLVSLLPKAARAG